MIKVEQDSNSGGKFRLFDPISNRRTKYPNKTLNLFDFRVVELTKAYTLRYQVRARSSTSTNEIEQVFSFSDISIFGVNKVVMFPNSPWTRDGPRILGLGGGGEDKREKKFKYASI